MRRRLTHQYFKPDRDDDRCIDGASHMGQRWPGLWGQQTWPLEVGWAGARIAAAGAKVMIDQLRIDDTQS